MKKSEKIEIRLSHEEKQKLTEIAEGEGRTVSELVRGLINRYMAMSKPLVSKRSWGKLAAIAVAGVLLGHLGTWALMRGQVKTPDAWVAMQDIDVYRLTVILMPYDEGGDYQSLILETPLVSRDGASGEYIIAAEGDDYKVTTVVKAVDDLTHSVALGICHLREAGCDVLAAQTFLLAGQQPVSVSFMSDRKDEIQIGFKHSNWVTVPIKTSK